MLEKNIRDVRDRLLLCRGKDVFHACDLTLGNGYDALCLLKCCPNLQSLHVFDIQHQAIVSARSKLPSDDRIIYHEMGHQDLNELQLPLQDFMIMNLGYLPGGDKAITTRAQTTIPAIRQALELLISRGILFVAVYPGHPEGAAERDAILDFGKQLDQNLYHVVHTHFLNQRANPPEAIIFERI